MTVGNSEIQKQMSLKNIQRRIEDILQEGRSETMKGKDVAEAIGLTSAQLSTHRRRGSIPFKKISEFCAKNKLSINWVIFGQSMREIKKDERELIKLTLLDGEGPHLPKRKISVDPRYAKEIDMSGGNIEAIKMYGEAMKPTLKDGSIVLFDKTKTDIRGGNIFVMEASGLFFVRRLTETHTGGINVISENPLMEPHEIQKEDATILGRVVAIARKI